MKEFVLIFRVSDIANTKPSPEQMRERMNWLASIAAQNKLSGSNTLSVTNAKTVLPGDVITDGPYTEIKEFVSGYVIVKAASIEEAIALAKTNPTFKFGGNIEVREVIQRPS
jgi:hypothetical protein